MAEYRAAAATSRRMTEDGAYLALDNETPKQIAEKLGVSLELLLRLNKKLYKGLTAKSKLRDGTYIHLRPGSPVDLEPETDEVAPPSPAGAKTTKGKMKMKMKLEVDVGGQTDEPASGASSSRRKRKGRGSGSGRASPREASPREVSPRLAGSSPRLSGGSVPSLKEARRGGRSRGRGRGGGRGGVRAARAIEAARLRAGGLPRPAVNELTHQQWLDQLATSPFVSGAHLVMGHHARRRAEAAKRGRDDRQDEEAEEEDDEDEQDDGDGDGPSIYDEGLSLGYGTAYVGVELRPGAILARVGAPETTMSEEEARELAQGVEHGTLHKDYVTVAGVFYLITSIQRTSWYGRTVVTAVESGGAGGGGLLVIKTIGLLVVVSYDYPTLPPEVVPVAEIFADTLIEHGL